MGRYLRYILHSLLALHLGLACSLSHSNPVAPVVASGSASMLQNGNQLLIINSANAIINWKSFSIAPNETTRFFQPSASSSVLNQVLGSDPSQILGQLQSNGKVFLVNPAGVVVGRGARIDVGGFVASALYLNNADFLAGKYNFQANPNAGTVSNQGSITTPAGGQVYLIAPQVSNSGIITAPHGEVILAAGKTVQLVDTGMPGVRVEITGDTQQATNLGTILSDAGRVGLIGALVKNAGTVNVSSVVNEGGRIFLRAVKKIEQYGQLLASGIKEGVIDAQVGGVPVSVPTRVSRAIVCDANGQNCFDDSTTTTTTVTTVGTATTTTDTATATTVTTVGTATTTTDTATATTVTTVGTATTTTLATTSTTVTTVGTATTTTDTFTATTVTTVGTGPTTTSTFTATTVTTVGTATTTTLATTATTTTATTVTTVGTATTTTFATAVTIAQCSANPSLAGCDSLCAASPGACTTATTTTATTVTTVGTATTTTFATAVTIAQCSANPTLSGCSVLCAASPGACTTATTTTATTVTTVGTATTTTFATAVTVEQCKANPSAPGCAALCGTCTFTPVVTIAECAANPALQGCTTLCAASPGACTTTNTTVTTVFGTTTTTLAGTAVTIAQCSANPSLAGCTSLCAASPGACTTGGTTVTIAQCSADPTLPGCTTLCAASPGACTTGGTAVTIAQCSANPSLAGCATLCAASPGACTTGGTV
ncbi:MAG: filamentous hemagglutinin N-terminal domain-containing protein, partial [Betaproteobacteria bacterium]|nr:filamentous hemagglutinin N-terminal domain-containing protein [Betaproteobacteria bacterium]